MKKFLYKPLSSGRKYFFEDFKALSELCSAKPPAAVPFLFGIHCFFQ